MSETEQRLWRYVRTWTAVSVWGFWHIVWLNHDIKITNESSTSVKHTCDCGSTRVEPINWRVA